MRPYIFIAAIPLAVIFAILRKYFLRTGQQLKLLEAEGESEGNVGMFVTMQCFFCFRIEHLFLQKGQPVRKVLLILIFIALLFCNVPSVILRVTLEVGR